MGQTKHEDRVKRMEMVFDRLYAMAGGRISKQYVRQIWTHECDRDSERAANWIADHMDTLQQEEAEWREKKKEVLQYVERYGCGQDRAHVPNQKVMGEEKKVRYINNDIVTTKGERFIMEKTGKSKGKKKSNNKTVNLAEYI